MKPTTTRGFVSPVRPHQCQSRPVQGSAGRAAGAQGPGLPAAQEGQAKRAPGLAGGVALSKGGHRPLERVGLIPPTLAGSILAMLALQLALTVPAQAAGKNARAGVRPAPTPQATQPPTLTAPTAPTAASARDPEEPPPGDTSACMLPDENLAPVMVSIRPGRFWMGSPEDEEGRSEDESPQHRVTIPHPFALSRCEITVAQFRRFVHEAQYVSSAQRESSKGCYIWNSDKKEGEWSKRAFWDKPGFTQTEQHPVVCISYKDAQAYVDWLSQKTGAVYRLPTEAEWEYAARADTETARYYGKEASRQCAFANGLGLEGKGIADKNWSLADCDDTFVYTAPVASFRPNGFLLYDMLGNVLEWTQDCWHESYKNAPKDGSAWLEADGGDCKSRVVRGGSWGSGPLLLRSASRGGGTAGGADGDRGFRVARDF